MQQDVTMHKNNDSFPFMNDQEVTTYWEAVGLPQDQLETEHKRVLQQKENEPDLLTLNELMEKLKEGHVVSASLFSVLDNLYRVTDAERLTA